MKRLVYKFENENYEIVTDKINNVTIKDKMNETYYEVPYDEFTLKSQVNWKKEVNIHSTFLFCVYWIVFIILFVVNLKVFQTSIHIDKLSVTFFGGILAIYLLAFIIIHEIGHLFMLHICGRQANKFGFKINYIFPSFYVRINEVYMLDKFEKLYVHSAGLMNSLILNVTTFFVGKILNNNIFIYISVYMSMTIVYNLIPFLNSDGYKMLITIANKTEKRNTKNNSKLILVFKILDIVFVLAYTIYFLNGVFYGSNFN